MIYTIYHTFSCLVFALEKKKKKNWTFFAHLCETVKERRLTEERHFQAVFFLNVCWYCRCETTILTHSTHVSLSDLYHAWQHLLRCTSMYDHTCDISGFIMRQHSRLSTQNLLIFQTQPKKKILLWGSEWWKFKLSTCLGRKMQLL